MLVRRLQPVLAHPFTHLSAGVGILLLDLVTGPFLQFPILFVIPVSAAAWFCQGRLTYWLAVLLPVGRFVIAELVEHPSPTVFITANCLTRIVVLVLISGLVRRTARQSRELAKQVDTLVTVCAWSRTVEYENQWISFEEYLFRRFGIRVTHGISPEESARVVAEFKAVAPQEKSRNIEHLALQVPEPAAMADWYVQHLGMRVVRSGPAPVNMRFLADSTGRTVLEIYNNPKASVPNYRQLDPLHIHIAFQAADVVAERSRLLAAGCTAEGEVSVMDNGDVLAMLRDPWGVPLQLVKRGKALL